jgi:hypothetical protein
VKWQYTGDPEAATACNCTICRRYGTLWIYGFENGGVSVSGRTQSYVRGPDLMFHFCPVCGCVAYWRGVRPKPNGLHRMGLNVRLAEPEEVAHLPVHHFDGLVTGQGLPRDGRCVADYWG